MFWCPFPSRCASALENTAVRACVRAACMYPLLHACTHTTRRSFVRSFVVLIGQCVDMPRYRGGCRCRCCCVRVYPDNSYHRRARVWSMIFVFLRAAAETFCREESASHPLPPQRRLQLRRRPPPPPQRRLRLRRPRLPPRSRPLPPQRRPRPAAPAAPAAAPPQPAPTPSAPTVPALGARGALARKRAGPAPVGGHSCC